MQNIVTDNHGYLVNYHDWSEVIAMTIAKKEGIILSQKHWKIIKFFRKFYLRFNTVPTLRILIKGLSDPEYDSRSIFDLFPKGPVQQATKIAGLPRQIRCL